MTDKRYKKSRMKPSIVALVMGGGLVLSTALSSFIHTPSVYADNTDPAIDSLATSLVTLSTEVNDTSSSFNLQKIALDYVRGFQQKDWSQLLFQSDTATSSQQQLINCLQSFLTLGGSTSTLSLDTARGMVQNVISSMTAMSSSIQKADVVAFLQNIQANSKAQMVAKFPDLRAGLASSIQMSYANLPSIKLLFTNSAGSDGGVLGGIDGSDSSDSSSTAFDPTSLDSYKWLQQGSNDGMAVFDSFDPTKLQSELSGLSSDTKHVIIPMTKGATQIDVTSDVLSGLRSKLNAGASLTFGNGTNTYGLPLSLLPSNTNKVTVSIQKVDTTTQTQFTDALKPLGSSTASATSSASLLGTPVDFTVTVQTPNGTQNLSDFGHVFTTRSFFIPASNTFDPSSAAVVMWDPTTKSLLPVPSRIVKDGSGHYQAVASRTGNSVYGVISYKKSFTDVTSSLSWAKPAISRLTSELVLSGTSDAAFSPNANVTRAEFVTMLVRALGLSDKSATGDLGQVFGDVKAEDWFAHNVAIAKQLQLVAGDASNHFNPAQSISRQEMATMIANALKFVNPSETSSSDVLQKFADRSSIEGWATNAASLLVQDGIISGRTATKFAPKQNATRAEAAVMIEKLLEHEGFSDPQH